MKIYKGYLIAFEGIDGCGKSSVLPLVKKELDADGLECLITHEPRRESPWGKQIYKILHGQLPMASPLELQKLYVEDRYDHVVNEIKPALYCGEIILADRYWFSTLAYGLLEAPLDKLISLHDEVFGGAFLKPDLTFIFDLPAKTALSRLEKLGKSTDHFEKMEKLSRIRQNYLTLAAANLGKTVVINKVKSTGEIADIILQTLRPLVAR